MYCMKDAFLLGAGFSQAIHKKMPTMNELFEQLEPLVGVENGVSAEAYEYARRFAKVETLLSYYAVPNPADDHVEVLRKRIVTRRLEERIGSVLQCRERRLDRLALTSSMALGQRLVDKWMEQNSHVLTANYDTVVEQLAHALDDTQASVLYPIPVIPAQAIMGHNPAGTISGEDLTLYKLHGSISWYTSQDEPNSDPIYGCVEFGVGTITPREKLLGDKRRLIAPPVHDKSTLLGHEHMRNLWRQAKNNALAPADRLYVIGYSLPETDMAMRTLLWESRQPIEQGEQLRKIPLYVVDKNRRLFDHYQEMLGHWYDVKDTYLGDDAFERFVKDYARD